MTETPASARKARVPLNLRVGEGGKAALQRIATHRTRTTGKKVTVSDVARAALSDYATQHDPARQRR